MKRILPNSRLSYLDKILEELEKDVGKFVSEDIIAPKVSFEKVSLDFFGEPGEFVVTKKDIPEGYERMFFRTAMIYLEKLGLIIRKDINPMIPDYSISFEGLILVRNGGLLKKHNNERIKDILQKAFWILAFIVFTVNTFFLIKNYNLNILKKTQELNLQTQDSIIKKTN